MIELVFFCSAIVAILFNLVILAGVLRVPLARVALSTVFFCRRVLFPASALVFGPACDGRRRSIHLVQLVRRNT